MRTYIRQDGETLATFDCERQRDVNVSGVTSGYAREDNAQITDHYTRQPTILTLSVVQTDRPIDSDAADGRANSLRDVLDVLLSSGDVVDVVTDEGVFEQYVLTGAPYSRSWSVGGSYQPTLTFQQVRFATSATAVLSVVGGRDESSGSRRSGSDADAATNDEAGAATERGRVPTEPASPPAVGILEFLGVDVPPA